MNLILNKNQFGYDNNTYRDLKRITFNLTCCPDNSYRISNLLHDNIQPLSVLQNLSFIYFKFRNSWPYKLIETEWNWNFVLKYLLFYFQFWNIYYVEHDQTYVIVMTIIIIMIYYCHNYYNGILLLSIVKIHII